MTEEMWMVGMAVIFIFVAFVSALFGYFPGACAGLLIHTLCLSRLIRK